ncbi:uncharacterized protein [Nicotiana tomentosiformis]|uniref:uncharacterized protein n=1 Tax=Nicotiana tomentosiformis TaxID=4098 RepID=UPI00388CE633
MTWPTGSVETSSSSVCPYGQGPQISVGRCRGRGGASGSGGQQNHIFALSSRQDLESSPDVVTDPGSTLSYVTPFVAGKCEMVEFDVIMGMDWLDSCYANMDCWTKVVPFNFPREPVIEWKGDVATPKEKFISYLKARKIILKWCIYHLVHVQDMETRPTTLKSVPVINEFPNELLSIPTEREIEFTINVLTDTQPISIPRYMMVPVELKDLKAQLKDLLDKGFI